eukprot:Gregarina_sp_Poly_1__3483@NODE_200_length_11544_cov_123_517644_g179_i0_p5_GENE_NODE_200_length_11544_cov_123_517644_g179_i0NODE_200_length_11544_cov_123_517644_g179_i0_p5_ORF_typecomplete_len224_score35_81ORC2/PF04084_14/0_13_NODE_200_length_11544_cov_123_517644_g179_i043745045
MDTEEFKPYVNQVLLPLTTKGLRLIGTLDDVRAPVNLLLWDVWRYPVVVEEGVHTHELYSKEFCAEYWHQELDESNKVKYRPDEKSLESQLLYELCFSVSSQAETQKSLEDQILRARSVAPEIVIETPDVLTLDEFVAIAESLPQRRRELLIKILEKLPERTRSRRGVAVASLKLSAAQMKTKDTLLRASEYGALLAERNGVLDVRLAQGNIAEAKRRLGLKN